MTLTKVTVVLGSGRSMTSGVAKGLHLAGFPMGEPMVDASASNTRGHYEHRTLVEFNDRVLASMGTDWLHPPLVGDHAAWSRCVAEWGQQAALYLHDRHHESSHGRRVRTNAFGMKDPRVTALWPLWDHAFNVHANAMEPILVAVQRNQEHAAASLAARDQLALADARRVVREYQVRARQILQGLWQAPPVST